jgi:hypothetical protein
MMGKANKSFFYQKIFVRGQQIKFVFSAGYTNLYAGFLRDWSPTVNSLNSRLGNSPVEELASFREL